MFSHIDWSAVSIVASVATTSIGGIIAIGRVANAALRDLAVLKTQLNNVSEDLTNLKDRVDFVFEKFFNPGK